MALSFEEKEVYVAIIDGIWSGSMSANSVENITDEVADEIALVLSERKTC